MGKTITLNFDESGNMGRSGRYFTIACIQCDNIKPLTHVVRRSFLKVKREFPQFSNSDEIKASNSNPIIKDYVLRKISSKDVQIRYIVSDLLHVKPALIDDENLLYNYMLHFLILPVAKEPDVDGLIINIDKRTIKVKSENSFEDYIKLKANFELGSSVNIKVNYYESQNLYAIQAADFVANAIFAKYEYNYDYYYDILKNNICQSELFPWKSFGK